MAPTRELSVIKAHGTGNDFVVVIDPDDEVELAESDVQKLCDRHMGIGADGILRAVRVEDNPEAEWFMDYRNADGSLAEMCGNGIRVFVDQLIRHDLANIPSGGTIPILTRGGVRDVTVSAGGHYQVDLGRWELTSDDLHVTAAGLDVARPALGISLPNPHAVVVLAHDEDVDGLDLSAAPRVSPEPADGVNVEFVVPLEPLVDDGVGRIRMRVFERGVGETLSCGTGAAAAALAARHFVGASAPQNWQVHVPGGTLGVRMFPAEEGEHVGLSGPATEVFRTTVSL